MRNNAHSQDIQRNNPYPITPAITTIAMPLLIGRRKKLSLETAQEKSKETQPKSKATEVEKYEVTPETLKFFVKKGWLKKRFVVIKEIPVYEISGIESLGNELSVTWKVTTDWFVLKKKSASFNELRKEIQNLLDKNQKKLEAQAKVTKRKNDLTTLLNFSVGIVNSSFDMLMDLQRKPVNWSKLDIYASSLIEKTGFSGQTLAPLTLDFSKAAEAVESQMPEKASIEIFCILKTIYAFFEELRLEEDIEQAHPNFKEAKAAILACFTLNDIWLGKLVGEKESQQESQVFQAALQSISNNSSFKMNFEALKADFDKMDEDAELERAVEDSRAVFLELIRNMDRRIEQPSIEKSPIEQQQPSLSTLQESVPSPAQTGLMQHAESQVPGQPPAVIPAIEPQLSIQTLTKPAPIVQTELVIPSEHEQQPASSPEPQLEPVPKPFAVEQKETLPPSIGEPGVQMPGPSESVSPPSEEEKARSEVAPKKKSFGSRIRKAVMGY